MNFQATVMVLAAICIGALYLFIPASFVAGTILVLIAAAASMLLRSKSDRRPEA